MLNFILLTSTIDSILVLISGTNFLWVLQYLFKFNSYNELYLKRIANRGSRLTVQIHTYNETTSPKWSSKNYVMNFEIFWPHSLLLLVFIISYYFFLWLCLNRRSPNASSRININFQITKIRPGKNEQLKPLQIDCGNESKG